MGGCERVRVGFNKPGLTQIFHDFRLIHQIASEKPARTMERLTALGIQYIW